MLPWLVLLSGYSISLKIEGLLVGTDACLEHVWEATDHVFISLYSPSFSPSSPFHCLKINGKISLGKDLKKGEGEKGRVLYVFVFLSLSVKVLCIYCSG